MKTAIKNAFTHKPKRRLSVAILLLTSPFFFGRCGDSFMKSSTKNEVKGSFELAATADAAGNYTGTIDPNSTGTQVLRASSGELSGSAISLPAGALSINLNITIGSGETLASSDVTQQLGLSDNPATAAGPAVSFVPSQNVQASSPFTLSIPTAATSLALAGTDSDNLVVMYKWMIVENGVTTYAIGIIPRDSLTVGSKTVQFQTTKFGTFQLAVTQTKITAPVNKPTSEPPVLKADASNPLVGVWTQCYSDSDKNYNGNPTPTPTPTMTPTPTPTPTPMPTLGVSGSGCSGSGPVANISPSFPSSVVSLDYTYTTYVSGGITSGPTAIPTTNFSVTLGSAVFNDQVALIRLSPNCKVAPPIVGIDNPHEFYFTNACYPTTFSIVCDDAAYQADLLAAPSFSPSPSPSPSPTSTSTSTNNGGGKDHLGIPFGTQVYAKESVKFSASTFIHSRSIFSEANCTGTMISRIEETGSYKLGATNADSTMPISITFATNTGTIFQPSAVSFANANPVSYGCGFADWVSGQSKDLFTSMCNKDSNNGPSLVKIQGNNIYFSDNKTNTINTNDYMTRAQ